MQILTIEKKGTTFSKAFFNIIFLISLFYQEILNLIFAFNLPFYILVPFDIVLISSICVIIYYIITHFSDDLDFNTLRKEYKFMYHYTLFGIELNMFFIVIFLLINIKTNDLSFLLKEYQCFFDVISLIILSNIRNIMIYKVANIKMPIKTWFKRKIRSFIV